MQKKVISSISVLLLICIMFVSNGFANTTIKTAWLGEHETFILWYAKKHGLDKKLGYNLELLHFNSGKEIIDSKKAYKWDIAGMGAIPLVTSLLNQDNVIVAIANNEAKANAVYAREDSDIFSVKGYNPVFENMYGAPKLLKGKKIFSTRVSSAQYVLAAWINTLGLQLKDVNVQFMEQRVQVGAMDKDFGDIYSLWSPYTFQAEQKGLKTIVTGSDLDLLLPIVIVADEEFVTKNPEKIIAFLDVYTNASSQLLYKPLEDFTDDYIAFTKEWTNISITKEEALIDLKNHPVFSVEEQIDLLAPEGAMSKWLVEAVTLYNLPGTRRIDLTQMNIPKVNNSFLKALTK